MQKATRLLTTKQYKLDKSLGVSVGTYDGVLSAGISLSPKDEASSVLKRSLPTTCAMAGACAKACLVFTGMNQYPTHAIARARRTAEWFEHRSDFIDRAVAEFQAVARKATRHNKLAAGRPNLLSDLPAMARAIARRLPGLQFYDYSKLRYPWKRTTKNYHLTYSISERSTADDVRGAFDHGINCAIVLSDVLKGEPIPKTYTAFGMTRPTVDGDLHDLRFLDPVGVYVLLRFKGSKARREEATRGQWARPANGA